MLILDLRWLLFILLTTLAISVVGVYEFTRWWERRLRYAGALAALQLALEDAPIATLWLDERRTYHYANVQARRLFGLPPSPGALPSAPWTIALDEDLQPVSPDGLTPLQGRYRNIRLTGENGDERALRWWVTPWDGFFMLFVMDITTQQRTTQRARQILSDLAHELRTPLATLLTHLEILRLPAVDNEVRSQSLQFMKDETQRLVRLVNNTLELGRLESGGEQEMRPVELLSLAEDALAQILPQAQAVQANIIIQAGGPLPLVLGQPERLKQVLLNLLENAIKYGAPGNQITMRLRNTTDGLYCAVCDTGPGISADHLPYVTQRFYRAAPAGVSGSGLGLALVAEILRQHQSQVHITSHTAETSTPNVQGTCVHFTLPVVVQKVQA